MLKKFFSLFASGQPAPQAVHTGKPSGQSDDVLRQLREMAGAQSRPKKEEPPRIHYDHPRERDDIPTELKFATYRDGPRYTRVAYAIFHGNRCVFTWADNVGGSTVQNGEYVARVIARRERRPLESLRFYDLQTEKSYGRGGADGVGGMLFEEIILECSDTHTQHAHIKSWIHAECPDYVLELFREYVADSRPQHVFESASKDF